MLNLFFQREKKTEIPQTLLEYQYNAAPIGMLTVLHDGTIDMHNAAFALLFKQKEENVAGQSFYDFLEAEDREPVRYAFSHAKEKPDPTPLEIKLPHHWAGACELFIGRSDKPDGTRCYVVHCLDITERKKYERQFAQSQKMQAMGQMAGGVAHEINNLLTAIGGYADLLAEHFVDNDEARENVRHIKSNTERAARTVKQMLAFSRQQKLSPEVVDLQECIEDAAHLFKRLIREDISLTLTFANSALWHVKVDKVQLEQALMNFVVNAVDAMPSTGIIDITVANKPFEQITHNQEGFMPEGEYVAISVRDSGTGMSEEIRKRIFEPFFTTKDVGKGTGLGLAMVYGFVKQTGGFVFCDSIVGEGTTFTIYLPRDTSQIKCDIVETAPVDTSPAQGVILFVEDEDPVRGFGKIALQKQGYTVVDAANGNAALEALAAMASPPDVLITDVMMPEMDGTTLIRLVRAKYPSMKVICMSGYAEEAMREKLNDFPHIHFMGKPFSLQQLVLTVKTVLVENAAR